MKIQVTQQDIDSGERCSCTHCPIARAVHRAADAEQVAVASVCYVVAGGKSACYRLPVEADDFIIRFDFGLPVVPFEFEMVE